MGSALVLGEGYFKMLVTEADLLADILVPSDG